MTVRSILLTVLLVSAGAGCAVAQSAGGTIPDAPQQQNQAGQQSQTGPQSQASPQDQATPQDLTGRPEQQDDAVTIASTPRHILSDQAAIWRSPAHLKDFNAVGPALLVLATAVVITTDHQVMADHVPVNASLNNHAITASNGLLGGFVAAPAIIYGLGHIHHDDHATETGILAGEAMVDSLAVDEVLKAVSMRERPTVDDARGKFFQTSVGMDSSFPSTHSIIAWSSAAVIASEYGGLMTQITAYGLATGVSATRVLGRQHFPSDVIVGSAVGWMIGRYVVRRRRRTE
jgi:membrane-associated phospholipid phosphatase